MLVPWYLACLGLAANTATLAAEKHGPRDHGGVQRAACQDGRRAERVAKWRPHGRVRRLLVMRTCNALTLYFALLAFKILPAIVHGE